MSPFICTNRFGRILGILLFLVPLVTLGQVSTKNFKAKYTWEPGGKLQLVLEEDATFVFTEDYNNTTVVVVVKNVYSYPVYTETKGHVTGDISYVCSDGQSGNSNGIGSYGANYGVYTTTDEHISFPTTGLKMGDTLTVKAGTLIHTVGGHPAFYLNEGPYEAVIANYNFDGAAAQQIVESATPPVVTTASASFVSSNQVAFFGTANGFGAATEVFFLYGKDPTLTGANTIKLEAIPPILPVGSGQTSLIRRSLPLEPGTRYYYRTMAVSANGTGLGEIKSFDTPASFTPPAGVCFNGGVQQGLGGATPEGGVYSGPGVQDNGDGKTYNFDPEQSGAGTHTISYNYNGVNTFSQSITVHPAPQVAFSAEAPLCSEVPQVNGLQGGTPTGGVYSGFYVTHNAESGAFGFNTAQSGPGQHNVFYTYIDGNGCLGQARTLLTVQQPVNVEVEVQGSTLVSMAPNAVYQWLDCGQDNAPVEGETAQSFTPSFSGLFAVKVTQGTCSATSTCVNMVTTGLEEFNGELNVFPNPAATHFTVSFPQVMDEGQLRLVDLRGSVVREASINGAQHMLIETGSLPTGLYLLQVITLEETKNIRLKVK